MPGRTYVSLLWCLAALLTGPDLFLVSGAAGWGAWSRLRFSWRCLLCLPPRFLCFFLSLWVDPLPPSCPGVFSAWVIISSVCVATDFLRNRSTEIELSLSWYHWMIQLQGWVIPGQPRDLVFVQLWTRSPNLSLSPLLTLGETLNTRLKFSLNFSFPVSLLFFSHFRLLILVSHHEKRGLKIKHFICFIMVLHEYLRSSM